MTDEMNYKSIFEGLSLLFRYRYRLFEGVAHDVRQQYTGSVLGVFWVLLFPLLQLTIYACLYVIIFKVRPSGLTAWEYTLMVFSGLVPLLAFSQGLVAATSSLTANKSLLLNTVFPAELIPVRVFLSAQMPNLFGLLITIVLGLVMRRTAWQVLLLIPVYWVFLLMFGVGISWILSLLSLVLRDIQHSLGLILMLVTLLSPFSYTPEMVPEALRFLLYFNPLSYFVFSFQRIIAFGTLPDMLSGVLSIFIGLIVFITGYAMFRNTKHIFFDYA